MVGRLQPPQACRRHWEEHGNSAVLSCVRTQNKDIVDNTADTVAFIFYVTFESVIAMGMQFLLMRVILVYFDLKTLIDD